MPRALLAAFAASLLAGCAANDLADAPRTIEGPSSLPGVLLTGDPRVIVEIDFIDGRAPLSSTLRQIEAALHDVAGKRLVVLGEPQPISRITPDIDREWSPSDITSIAWRTEEARPVSGAYLHLVFLDGRGRDERGPFRGLQVGETLAVFPDALKPTAALPRVDGPRFTHHARLEAQVTLHELGHAFGLVDCGLPMGEARADPGSPCHSTHEASVMRAYVDLIDMARDGVMDGSAVPSWYDAADLADIRTFQRG